MELKHRQHIAHLADILSLNIKDACYSSSVFGRIHIFHKSNSFDEKNAHKTNEKACTDGPYTCHFFAFLLIGSNFDTDPNMLIVFREH